MTYLEIVAEMEKGATELDWGVGANPMSVDGSVYDIFVPEPHRADRSCFVANRVTKQDARLIAFLRNTLGEVRAVVEAAREIEWPADMRDCIQLQGMLDLLDAKAQEVSE